jgi:hypothetical protein
MNGARVPSAPALQLAATIVKTPKAKGSATARLSRREITEL